MQHITACLLNIKKLHVHFLYALTLGLGISDLVSEGHNPVKGHIYHTRKSVTVSEFNTKSIWITVKEQTCLLYISKHRVHIDRIYLQA